MKIVGAVKRMGIVLSLFRIAKWRVNLDGDRDYLLSSFVRLIYACGSTPLLSAMILYKDFDTCSHKTKIKGDVA